MSPNAREQIHQIINSYKKMMQIEVCIKTKQAFA